MGKSRIIETESVWKKEVVISIAHENMIHSTFRTSSYFLTRKTIIPSYINSLPHFQIRHATKKAGGSTTNGRDSAGRRLGIKVYPGNVAKAGSIIIRQRGQKYKCGENVGMGRDHTIFSKVLGIVKFTTNARKKRVVHVLENARKKRVVHVLENAT